MKKYATLFCFILLYTTFCFSQNANTVGAPFDYAQGKRSRTTDSLLTVLKTAKQDTTKVNALNALFLQYEFTDDAKAKDCLNSALRLSQKSDYKKGLAKTFTYLGYFEEDKGNYQEALKKYLASLKLFKEMGDQKGISDAYNNIGNACNSMGNFKDAIKNYFACLKIQETTGNKKGIATSYYNIGNAYSHQGNYSEALKNYFASLKIREAISDKTGIANTYNCIGVIYKEQGNYPMALENYFASLKLHEETGNNKGIAAANNNIGNIYQQQGKYPEALKSFFASLKIKEAMGDKRGIASSTNNIGNVYYLQGNYPEALEKFLSSLKIKEEIGDNSGIAVSYFNIGNGFLSEKKYNEAADYLMKAKELANKIGYKDCLKNTYFALNKLDSATGNFKGAYENHKLFLLYRDSLDNEEIRKKTIQTQMTYEFEKKEAVTLLEQEKKEVAHVAQSKQQRFIIYIVIGAAMLTALLAGLLVYQNKLRSKHKTQDLEQKLLRVQMNPHFIFNSLNSIQSYIYKNDSRHAGIYLSKFAELMRMILANSRENYVSLEREIKGLHYYLELQQLRFENKFDYTIETPPEMEPEIIAIPPMLAQPFIENAIEHGLNQKPGKGHILIRFSCKNNTIVFEVEDDGIGVEHANEIKKSSNSAHKSFATLITMERLVLLNKKSAKKISMEITDLKTIDKARSGTRVAFNIPYKEI